MTKQKVMTNEEFEEQIFHMKEKSRQLERRLSSKVDEQVFSISVSHKKEVDALKEEVFKLRSEIKNIKKEKKARYLERMARQAKQRRVV
ncbi:hypothetical protein EQV77_03135 [Halobacillus fulvus]|nr:hypothetical protein EQV77_03135 [Halobacillus fulvus]